MQPGNFIVHFYGEKIEKVHSTVVPLTLCLSETRISQMYLKSAQVTSDLLRYFKRLLVFGRIHMNMLRHTRSSLSKLST